MGIRVPRVVNGVSGFAPYQVSLEDTATNQQFCGGAILNAFIILTAAHCLVRRGSGPGEDSTKRYYKWPNEIRVVAGQFNQQWPDTTAQQIRYIQRNGLLPAGFDYGTLEYDIVILQLKTPLKINKFVRPIPLPIDGRLFKGNVTIYGWGATRIFSHTKVEEFPSTLQVTEMSIISNAECRRTQSNPGDVNENMGCAQSNRSAICAGDSGSPVICKDHLEVPPPPFTTEPESNPDPSRRELLCGIVSWTTKAFQCDVDDDGELISPPPPIVFTKVSSYTAWITRVLRNQVVVKGHFLCNDLQYIPQAQQCDGNKDCQDGSDEGNCSSSSASSIIAEGSKDVITTEQTTMQTTTELYIKSTTENITTTDVYNSKKWSTDLNSSIIPFAATSPPCNRWSCMFDFRSPQETLLIRACLLSNGGFLCPQVGYKCLNKYQLCDATVDCTNGIDENVDDCKFYSKSKSNITTKLKR